MFALIELFIAEYDLIALYALLEDHLLHLFFTIAELHLRDVLYVEEEIFLESLDSQVLLVAGSDPALLIYFEIEEIDPLYAFELIFYEHFIE